MSMQETESPRADLERLFMAVLYGADPLRRASTPDIRRAIEACVDVSLEAIGLIDESEGEPDLTGLLEFGRKCFKPWAGENVESAIESALKNAAFALLSPAELDRLAARLRVVVSETMSTATFI
jgi:hypothetical protein